MKNAKAAVVEFLKHNKGARVAARKMVWQGRKISYKVFNGGSKLDDKLVLFESFMGRKYGCNPRAIYEAMISDKRFDDFTFVWAFREPENANSFEPLKRARIVKHRSKAYFKYAATAKVIITNSELDYRIIPKTGQTFFQTWHGTPLKQLRCDIKAQSGNANNSLEEIKMRNDMDVVRYDYFLSPSEFTSEVFTSAFNLRELNKEKIIFECGYPRNDLLMNYKQEDVVQMKASLGIPENKKVILYAPTFRDNRHDSASGYIYDLNIDFERMKRELGEEYVILFRTHYFVANKFDFAGFKGFVYDVSKLDDITELYLISDMLITDYSSVFFDYANLKRKMIFYMHDLEQYANDIRGFYISLEELPGRIVTTEDDLLDAIKDDIFEYNAKYAAFNDKYNHRDDGHAAEKVVNEVFSYHIM